MIQYLNNRRLLPFISFNPELEISKKPVENNYSFKFDIKTQPGDIKGDK